MIIVDLWSSNFARWGMGIYLSLVIASVVVLAVIILAGKWTDYEPWATILFGTPLITYVINIFAQLVFSKKISFEPSNIYSWLKEYRRKQIMKKLNIL